MVQIFCILNIHLGMRYKMSNHNKCFSSQRIIVKNYGTFKPVPLTHALGLGPLLKECDLIDSGIGPSNKFQLNMHQSILILSTESS